MASAGRPWVRLGSANKVSPGSGVVTCAKLRVEPNSVKFHYTCKFDPSLMVLLMMRKN